MKVFHYSILFLVVCAFLGCRNGKLNFRIHEKYSVNNILDYYEKINNMTNVELKEEYEKRKNIYIEEKNEEELIKYALIMILPSSEFYNSHKAAEIFDELIRITENKKNSYRPLVVLLKDVVTAGNKKEILYEKTNRKLDNMISEKKRQDVLYKEIYEKLNLIAEEVERKDSTNKKLNDELAAKKLTVEKLQKKIEKLKAIEKSINERKNTKEPTT